MLARELARRWDLPYESLLGRARSAQRQAGLAYAGRRTNIQGAFEARSDAPSRVLLVDDIYTTGATASASATALRRGGAARVEIVTFARAVR
jgi:predicted amidophosphoribosyltransferase